MTNNTYEDLNTKSCWILKRCRKRRDAGRNRDRNDRSIKNKLVGGSRSGPETIASEGMENTDIRYEEIENYNRSRGLVKHVELYT